MQCVVIVLGDYPCIVMFLLLTPSAFESSECLSLECCVWWRWALVSPDGVAPSRMVGVSASVKLPLHHKVQKFSSGTGSPGRSQKKGRKTLVCVYVKCHHYGLPSVLWLDVSKSIWPVKNTWWGAGAVICLEWGANNLHMVQLMLLPPHHLLLH